MQQDKFRHAEALVEPAVSSPPWSSGSSVLLSSVGAPKKTSAYCLYKLNKTLELIEELQSTSVTPDGIPGLLPLRKIAPKKTKAKLVTQVWGSMGAKNMLSKVQEMKAWEKEKEEKSKKKKVRKIYRRKTKKLLSCIAKISVCSNWSKDVWGLQQRPQSTCGKAACKNDGESSMMILPACNQSASTGSKRKLWYD